jgi:hypothetical protein
MSAPTAEPNRTLADELKDIQVLNRQVIRAARQVDQALVDLRVLLADQSLLFVKVVDLARLAAALPGRPDGASPDRGAVPPDPPE